MSVDKHNKGFTFIEMITVIAVMLILAAVIVPSVFGMIESARVTSTVTGAQNMLTGIENYYARYRDLNGITVDEMRQYVPALQFVNVVPGDGNTLYTVSGIPESKGLVTLEKNRCAISAVTTELSFTFTFYQNLDGIIYYAECKDGIVDEESVSILGEERK